MSENLKNNFNKQINIAGEYDVIKKTKYIRIDDRKYRISFISHSNKSILSIKVDKLVFKLVLLINKILDSKKYLKIKLYSEKNISHYESEKIIKALKMSNYSLEFNTSFHKENFDDKNLFVVLVKEK